MDDLLRTWKSCHGDICFGLLEEDGRETSHDMLVSDHKAPDFIPLRTLTAITNSFDLKYTPTTGNLIERVVNCLEQFENLLRGRCIERKVETAIRTQQAWIILAPCMSAD